MNYETFRTLWAQSLRICDLKLAEHTVQETLNPVSLRRSYRALVRQLPESSAPAPFSVSAELSWDWDALLTARFATTEEDVLTEFFGRKRRPKNSGQNDLALAVYEVSLGPGWHEWYLHEQYEKLKLRLQAHT